MIKMKKIIGLFLVPFLYTRYSFLLFLPFLIYSISFNYNKETIPFFLFIWFAYSILFAIIFGNFGLMSNWTKLIVKIFKINYKISGYWSSDMMYSFNIWEYPILIVKNKEYHLTISVSGGNLYEGEDNIRRKAIIYYLLK